MNGVAVILLCASVAVLLVVAYLLLEVDYEARRDVRRLERRQAAVEARRRTMRVLP